VSCKAAPHHGAASTAQAPHHKARACNRQGTRSPANLCLLNPQVLISSSNQQQKSTFPRSCHVTKPWLCLAHTTTQVCPGHLAMDTAAIRPQLLPSFSSIWCHTPCASGSTGTAHYAHTCSSRTAATAGNHALVCS
jgi:hypothetical protein